MHQERLLSIEDVKDRVEQLTGERPSYRTVHRWTTRGAWGRKLPTRRILGRVRIDPADLDAFLGPASESVPKVEQKGPVAAVPSRRRDERDHALRRAGLLD